MTREELKANLVSNPKGLMVSFTKADDSIRNMACTLNPKHLPTPTEAVKPKSDRKQNDDPNLIVVWDIQANNWRSFKFDSITMISKIVSIREKAKA